MKSLDEDLLKEIARKHHIDYVVPVASSSDLAGIQSEMSRTFAASKEELYAKIADLKDHTRLFSHLTVINVINSDQVANVIGRNQEIIVEGLAEGGSKLGIKLVTFYPCERIECELFTDLFESAPREIRADKKKGDIVWSFQGEGDSHCKMTAKSRFEVGAVTAYVRGTIDHVWLDFFENVMVDTGELKLGDKLCAPFPTKQQQMAAE